MMVTFTDSYEREACAIGAHDHASLLEHGQIQTYPRALLTPVNLAIAARRCRRALCPEDEHPEVTSLSERLVARSDTVSGQFYIQPVPPVANSTDDGVTGAVKT